MLCMYVCVACKIGMYVLCVCDVCILWYVMCVRYVVHVCDLCMLRVYVDGVCCACTLRMDVMSVGYVCPDVVNECYVCMHFMYVCAVYVMCVGMLFYVTLCCVM